MLSTYSRSTRLKTAVLENSINAVEGEKLNGVSDMTFSLPFNDAKNTHALIFGIYEGPRASSATLRVDGVNVPLTAGQTEIDVATKLSVDGGGKIRRGAYHTIEIIPDTLTRISATISVQLFIQSEGGGLY